MKKIFKTIFIFFMLGYSSFLYATDSSVTLITSSSGQTIKVFSSISDLNDDISPISILTTDSNFEALYAYNTNTNIKLYFKAVLDSTHDKGGISSYILQSGTDNALYLGVGGNLAGIVKSINEIKGPGYIVDTHSLATQTGALTGAEKNDIADRSRDRMQETGGLLKQIYELIIELLTRIFSIKNDTQKIL